MSGNKAGEHWQIEPRLPDRPGRCNRRSSTIDRELQFIRLVGTVFAALLGLAFGSFLNVVLARLPEGESIVAPRSHCRHCDHSLAWWENLPVLSWILLRGRCRRCGTWIGVRYPLVELAVGILWTACWLSFEPRQWTATHPLIFVFPVALDLTAVISSAVFCWLLVLLALLDAEFFWLPDWFTLPGIGLGILTWVLEDWLIWRDPAHLWQAIWMRTLAIAAAAGLILLIRLAYWIVRRVEGMGLGDAKLMAMLAAWLGLHGALECFAIAIFGAAIAATLWLGILAIRRSAGDWGKMPLPLGTFLCAAAISQIFYPLWLTGRMHLELLGLNLLGLGN